MVLLVGVLPAAPALAVDVRTFGSSRVLGEVSHQRFEVDLGSGAIARGDILRFSENDPNITLRPRLARGVTAGIQQFVPLAESQLRRGAIAGVNGGYWLDRPTGVPNGLHVTQGRMVAGQAVTRSGTVTRRGMVGIQPSGRMVMDEIAVDLVLDQPDVAAGPAVITELNRQTWSNVIKRPDGSDWRPEGEVLLFDDRFGAPITVPAGSKVVVVQGMDVKTSGRTEGTIVAVYTPAVATTYSVSPDRYAIVAYGDRAAELDVETGRRVGVTTTITPARTPAAGWAQLTSGVAGGQMLVQSGQRRPDSEWVGYSAFSASHATARQPRTAIGRTSNGNGMLVTVDGRRPGHSVGMTVRELADTMIALGVSDAVNLDGGGSTTMTVDARIRNRPSETGRSVADGLFLHAPLPPATRALTRACPEGGVPSAGFTDTPGTTHVASIDCLAWWKVTAGVSPTSYAPGNGVTRQQMATFVAQWIDGVTDRGDGRTLPAANDLTRFRDVTQDNVHAQSIVRLAEAGIINGRTATSFEPRGVMTRAQTASLLRGAIEYVTGSSLPPGRDTFLDDNTSVHEPNIDRLAGIGIISGTGGFTFRPEGQVTRGAMSSLIMRSSDLVVEQGRTTPPS